MIKLDTWLITKMEDAYLWFYDRSGVYLGTVGMVAMCISALCDILTVKEAWIKALTLFNVALIGWNMFMINSRQEKQDFLFHNSIVDFFRTSIVRLSFFFLFYLFAIVHAIQLSPIKMLGDVAFIFVMSTTVIKLREREPKDWFKAKEPDLQFATENMP